MDDNRSQQSRFEQAARELGVEVDEAKLRSALRQIAPDPSPRFVTYYLEQQEDGSWRFTGESTPT